MTRVPPPPAASRPYQPGVLAEVGIGWRHRHYAELLHSRPPLGFLEVHSENFFAEGGAALGLLQDARAHYPVSLHGVGLSLGSACGLDTWHMDQLARLVEQIDPVRVSDHASFARAPMRGQSVHGADLLPIPWSDEALAVLCSNVQRVQDRLKRPIAVENISAYVQWVHPPAQDRSEPDFLNTLAQRTGCGLLVDVNNIYVNALNARLRFGSDVDPVQACRQWLEAMDARHVVEMHLAGHSQVDDEHGRIVIDDHGARVCSEVWGLYRHAMDCFGPVPTLMEWDTDVPPLHVLLHEAATAQRLQATTPICA